MMNNKRVAELVSKSYNQEVISIKKFAELVVKDCIDICNNHYSIEGIAQNIEKDIREHFEIE